MIKLMLIILFVLTGCTSVSVVKLTDYNQRPATTKVDVYASKEAIKKKYREAALLSYNSDSSQEHAAERIIEKAKELGLDGVIIGTHQTSQQLVPIYGVGVMSVGNYDQKALGIIYE